jgi:transcriptional regulator with XRE-family HTH domain
VGREMSYKDVAQDIGDLFRSRRIKLKMSQQAVADKAGLPRSKIVVIETGSYDSQPTFDTIDKIAQALGLELVIDFEDKDDL